MELFRSLANNMGGCSIRRGRIGAGRILVAVAIPLAGVATHQRLGPARSHLSAHRALASSLRLPPALPK